MNFLFVYESAGVLGGIETLITRMSRWLTANGHTVTVLVGSGENWAPLLSDKVKCIELGGRFAELYYYYHAKRILNSLDIPKPDVVKSFDIGSSWAASQLSAVVGINCKTIAGAYNPYMFAWYYSPRALPRWSASKLYLNNYLKNIPSNARLFCGTDQVEELREQYQATGILWPLPIDTRVFLPAKRISKYGRIVSIGRLSAMKEYNLYMIEVIAALKKKGYPVTWTAFGTGEYESQMRQLIEKHNLRDAISLEGTVSYQHMWQALSDAHIFVGMGTAVLEAALFKVPHVIAQPYDRKGMTCGSVCGLPLGSITPGKATPVNLRVIDEIERILTFSAEEYRQEEESVYKHAQIHEMDHSMTRFIELLQQAETVKRSKPTYLSNYPLWIIRKFLKKTPDIGHPDIAKLTAEMTSHS